MKIIVCGGRDYKNEDFIFNVLDYWNKIPFWNDPIDEIILGSYKGADLLCYKFAIINHIKTTEFLYLKNAGRAGGPLRNKKMAEYGEKIGVDYCIAFKGGKGTASMIKEARKKHIEVLDYRDEILDRYSHLFGIVP
jgi:hypothetical protein